VLDIKTGENFLLIDFFGVNKAGRISFCEKLSGFYFLGEKEKYKNIEEHKISTIHHLNNY